MVPNKDVVAGRLLAELARHAHDLAAMERGMIDDMEQERDFRGGGPSRSSGLPTQILLPGRVST